MKHTILYLEDSPEMAEAVCAYLAKAGYEVDWVHNVKDARDLVSRRRYSMVLVDLRLSNSNRTLEGFQFACELQERRQSPLVVLFSACFTPEIEVETLRRRMKLISKPTPLPALRAMVSTYLRERYPTYSVTCEGSPGSVE